MIRLVSMNADRAAYLEALGFVVDASPVNAGSLVTQFNDCTASAVVIDLDRLPSFGREVGVRLRQGKKTRTLPLVFVGGAPDKVARVQQDLPDAVYTLWTGIAEALGDAKAGDAPVFGHMERYAGTPVAKKLGVRDGMKVALQGDPPDGFLEKLGEVEITESGEMLFWFVRRKCELEWFPTVKTLWVIFRKKQDFNQNDVRLTGLAAGLVDYKICAVDDEWSGMKFAIKKTDSPKAKPSSR